MASGRAVFVVTGSSAGVGAATVLLLARRGSAVVVNCSKSADEAEETAQRCVAAGGEALVVKGDVSQDADDFQRIYAVNTIGAYQMIRACEAPLRAARGAVVNVSTISSTMGIGSSVAYACSKGALNTLTLSLARALGPEIRVNAVLPGFIETRWLKQE